MSAKNQPLYISRPDDSSVETEAGTTEILPPPPSQTLSVKAFGVNSFVIEDSFYRARTAKPIHWSVAWSDLMMTMFVLFLSMFVYQASHEEFLVSDTPEIIGGEAMESVDTFSDKNIIVPIIPFTKDTPPIQTNNIRKIEKIHIDNLDIDEIFSDQVVFVEPENKNKTTVSELEENKDPFTAPGRTDVKKTIPLGLNEQSIPEFHQTDNLTDMYDMSKQLLSESRLKNFASIEVVPDKTMRIILTGDLLFFTGQAKLSHKARQSLTKIAEIIKDTPYMINVIGHTDNQPMHSSRFASNWELSVVRASSVARFLIEEIGMDSKQFIVSGFGSNRPRRPNTNVANRAVNRRVEIIISKRPVPAVKATADNLL